MKKIFCLIIAAALMGSTVSAFASEEAQIDMIDVTEVTEDSSAADQEVSTESPSEDEMAENPSNEPETTEAVETESEQPSVTEAGEPTETQSVSEEEQASEEITTDEPTEIMNEENIGEYVSSEIYASTPQDAAASEDDILAAESADVPVYISDEDLLLQTQDLTSGIDGWEVCSTMTEAKSYMASVAVDNAIYTFGGTKSGEVIGTTEVYDTQTELWTRKTSMPEGRYKHTALYLDGNIYICGGYDEDGNAVSGIARYNIANDAWADNYIITPNNNTNYASAIYNGELYIFGGKENGVDTKNSYKYNFVTNQWTSVMSMPVTSTDAKAAATSFGFYILSGTRVVKYELDKNEFEWVDNLPRTIMDYAFMVKDYTSTYPSTPSEEDCIVVSGGRESENSVSLASVKVRAGTDYTFTTPWEPEWYNDLRLIRGLSAHNMVEVNGDIYVFGGQAEAGEDQRLMFKRSADEWHDDYPDENTYDMLDGDYVYGSINDKNDVDCFRFTPSATGKYEVKTFNAIHTNNLGYKYHVQVVEEASGNTVTDSDLPINFGGIPFEAGKSYIIKLTDTAATWTGNYFFKMNMVTDDAPDTIDEAIELPLETTVSKTFLGKLDVDCMYFDIPVTGMYNVEVLSNGNTVANIKINANDSSKSLLYNYKNSTESLKNIRFNAGRYYISLSAPGTDYDYNNPEYTVRISNTAIYEHMNEARYRHGLAAVDGKLYAIGGLNSEYDTETMIESYDPSTGMWSKVTESDNTLRQGTTAVSDGSKIYLVGGVDDYADGAMEFYPSDDSIMIYDTVSNTWTGTGDLGIDRERVGLAVKDGDIYIAGGRSYSSTEYSDKIQVFDIASGTLSDYSVSLPTGIVDPQIFFSGEIMYVVGGVDEDGYSGKVYALENGTWVQKTSTYASTYMRGKSFNGNFFAAAVNTSGNVDILKYDTTADEWTTLYANYIDSLSYYGLDILNGLMYITGGYSITEDAVMDDTYSFDIATEISSMDNAIPVRTIGFEYEQTVTGDITEAPEITGVNAKVIDANKGIYELYLDEDDYTCDTRSTPFFFWSAREGMFRALDDDYKRVMFYADPGTGDRQVKVIVGIGDGRGYVDKKAFLLDGNNETE